MGLIGNSHGGFIPEERSLAEAIAATRLSALGRAVQGLSYFDEAGKNFWSGDREGAANSFALGFSLLKGARDNLDSLQDQDVELAKRISTNLKMTTAAELGIVTRGESELTDLTTGDRRIVAMIDHILLQEQAALAGTGSNDFQPCYRALASPGRHLMEDLTTHLNTVVRVSRFTHEWSDAVMRVINREEDMDPQQEFVGPAAIV